MLQVAAYCRVSTDKEDQAKSFVSIDALQLPIRLALDVLAEIPLLRFKGICLVFLIRGYTAIRCYL